MLSQAHCQYTDGAQGKNVNSSIYRTHRRYKGARPAVGDGIVCTPDEGAGRWGWLLDGDKVRVRVQASTQRATLDTGTMAAVVGMEDAHVRAKAESGQRRAAAVGIWMKREGHGH